MARKNNFYLFILFIMYILLFDNLPPETNNLNKSKNIINLLII